jgi:hypothetical protein
MGVELFFKWIKQHLKIKSFWRTTKNAVKYRELCNHRLLPCGNRGKSVENSAYKLRKSTDFRKSILDKIPINQLLIKYDCKNVKDQNDNLLLFN